MLLIADQNDENDFEGAVAGLAPLVAGKSPQSLLVSGGGAPGQIVNAFNAGQAVVNWVGHGTDTTWSKQNVFDTGSVAQLTNSWQLRIWVRALKVPLREGLTAPPREGSLHRSE